MPDNQYYPHGTGPGATVLTPAQWFALPGRTTGFQAGIAEPAHVNTAWRQSSVAASMLGRFIVTRGLVDALDNGVVDELQTGFEKGLKNYIKSIFEDVSADGAGIVHFGVDVGSVNAMSTTLNPGITALADGTIVEIAPAFANTSTTVTLTLTGPGISPAITKQVVRNDGSSFAAGDLKAGCKQLFAFDAPSNRFRILGQVASHIITNIAQYLTTQITNYAPQRLAFDQYFSDSNPIISANAHYDNDGDPNTSPPPLGNKLYEYQYVSAFPNEKTLINVVVICNISVQRPGADITNAYARGRATNAVGVKRNNYVVLESRQNAIAENWKSLAFSMLVGKQAGATSNLLQVHGWWGAQASAIVGEPYRVLFDDCEMLIIERVVDDLPSFPYSD